MLHLYFDVFYTYTNKFKILLFKPDPGHLPILEFKNAFLLLSSGFVSFQKRTFRREKNERNLARKKCLVFENGIYVVYIKVFFVEPRLVFCHNHLLFCATI